MSILKPTVLKALAGQEGRAADSGHAKFVTMGATTVLGHLEDGVVRLNTLPEWKEGQIVLVVPLGTLPASDQAPPVDLLEQDAAEFAPRREILRSASEDDLR